MRPTRRFWAVVVAGVCLLVLAPLTRQPAFFLGAVGLAAWLVVAQYRFIQTLQVIDEEWTIAQDVTPARTAAGEPLHRQVSVDGPTVPASVRVQLAIPAIAESYTGPSTLQVLEAGASPFETITPEATREIGHGRLATTSFEIEVAGRYTVEAPNLDVTDGAGLFSESFEQGPACSVVVETAQPPSAHIGAGGEQISAAYGEHEGGYGQRSIDAAEIREFLPGDTLRRVDWKASARLNELHVREFESQARRETILVVDHRASLGEGPADADWSKLTYLRDTALGITATAIENEDPLALYTIGDHGLTAKFERQTGHAHETRIQTRLRDLEVTEADTTGDEFETGASVAQLRADALADETSPFASTLRPLLETARPYIQRIASRPLFKTVETYVAKQHGQPWVVLFTDDTNRAELRETVKIARRGGRYVTVFICPSLFFTTHSLLDAEATMEAYLDFEEFRRELHRLNRVTALEVAPSDRFQTVRGGMQIEPRTEESI